MSVVDTMEPCCSCEKDFDTDKEGHQCENCGGQFCDTCYEEVNVDAEYHHPKCDKYSKKGGECHELCRELNVCSGCEEDWIDNMKEEYDDQDAESSGE
jgi:hypothetical protein